MVMLKRAIFLSSVIPFDGKDSFKKQDLERCYDTGFRHGGERALELEAVLKKVKCNCSNYHITGCPQPEIDTLLGRNPHPQGFIR